MIQITEFKGNFKIILYENTTLIIELETKIYKLSNMIKMLHKKN